VRGFEARTKFRVPMTNVGRTLSDLGQAPPTSCLRLRLRTSFGSHTYH